MGLTTGIVTNNYLVLFDVRMEISTRQFHPGKFGSLKKVLTQCNIASVTATLNDDCKGFARPECALSIVVLYFAVRDLISS